MGRGVSGALRARRVWLAVCALATVGLLLVAVPGSAFFQYTNVVITPDKSGYRVGDFANVTMRVFSFGLPTDPATITLRLNPLTPMTRTVNVTRQGVGLYNATFQIRSADVGPLGPYEAGSLVIQVSAGIGSLTDVETTSLQILPQATPGLTVTPSAYEAGPGAAVDLSLNTTVDGVARDADQVSVIAYVSSGSGASSSSPLSVANASVGNYSASYTVPADLVPPGVIAFAAVAIFAGVNVSRTVLVSIPGPQPFQIWAYQSVFAPPVVQFTIYVGDSLGGFEAGANVSLNYTYSSASTGFLDVTKSAASETDRYGRAPFGLNLSGASDVFDVTYRGNVTKGADRQAFSGVLYALSSGLPSSFQIVRANPLAFFDVNETAQLNYTVLASGHPVVGAHVYYYAQTDVEFLAAGNATSDSNGVVHLAIPIRAGVDRVLLTAKTGTSWYGMVDLVVPVHPLMVQTSAIRIGTVIEVNVTFPSSGPWLTELYLSPYASLIGSSPWLAISGFFGPETAFAGATQASYILSLPRFLPKDTDYVFYVVAVPESALSSFVAGESYAYSRVVHITNVPAQVQAALSTTSPAVGDMVTVNASASEDPDGYIVGYRVSWGDGNATDWSSSPVFTHSYAAPGDYHVAVAVEDDSGAVSVTQKTVQVEGTFLGLRYSLAIPLFVGGAVAAGAVLVAVWWRRRMRPQRVPPPEEANPPVGPREPGPPPETP